MVTSWCFNSSSSLLESIGLPHNLLSQQFPLAFVLLVVVFFIMVWAIHGPGPMSGPVPLHCLAVGVMNLGESPAPVLIDLEHEHAAFMLLVPDEPAFLLSKILVPVSECCCGARGGRMPFFASEAMRDFFLYLRFSQTMMMTSVSRDAHWYIVIPWYSVAPKLLPRCIPPSAEESWLDISLCVGVSV